MKNVTAERFSTRFEISIRAIVNAPERKMPRVPSQNHSKSERQTADSAKYHGFFVKSRFEKSQSAAHIKKTVGAKPVVV